MEQADDKPAPSNHAQRLPLDEKERYLQKLSFVGGLDPFCLNKRSFCEAPNLPPFSSSDLVSYLVLQTNYLSAKQFKSYKSLEAYNQFVSGWIKEVYVWSVNMKYVLTGKVSVEKLQTCMSMTQYCYRFDILSVVVNRLLLVGSSLKEREKSAVHIVHAWPD